MKELKISGTLRCVVVVPGVWVCVGATVVSGGFQSLSTLSFDLKCSTKEHQKSKSLFFFLFRCRQMDDADPSLRRCGVTDDRGIFTAVEKERQNDGKGHCRR